MNGSVEKGWVKMDGVRLLEAIGKMMDEKLEKMFDERLEEKLEKYRLDMEQAKLEYEKPFQYEAELKAKLARQFELNNLLDLENQASKEEEQEPEVSRAAEPSHGYGKEREGNR